MWRREPRLDIRVTPTHLDRALRIFDALVKALERRGIAVRVAVDDHRRETFVELFGETVTFWLEERTAALPRRPPKRPLE